MSALLGQIGELVQRASAVYAGGPAEPVLRASLARLGEPLRIAIAGRVKAGKSTLLNALVGQQLAATDAGECTKIVTWYVDGISYRIMLHPRGGPARQLPFRQGERALDIDLDGVVPSDVERLVIDWPSPTLRTMSLIDTPGMGSASTDLGRATESALAPQSGDVAAVDAVIYLMRHVHGDDVRFLEAFRDGSVDRRPVNTIGVLARADEVGQLRPDALETAARVAGRYRDDPRVRSLCQTVVPVAGLLAASAAGLRESDFRALAQLAATQETDRMLGGADRFVAEAPVSVPAGVRADLIDRFGLYGLRLSVEKIRRQEVTGAGDLARTLSETSGLPALRTLLTTQFAARADVLKSRSALSALTAVLRRWPLPVADRLVHDVERVQAGAHEFAEIALLDRVRDGVVMFTSAERAAAEQLLGAGGMDVPARLGLPPHAAPGDVLAAAAEQHRRWQRRAEHPGSTRDVAEAARVLVRTCEGVIGQVAPRTPQPAGPA